MKKKNFKQKILVEVSIVASILLFVAVLVAVYFSILKYSDRLIISKENIIQKSERVLKKIQNDDSSRWTQTNVDVIQKALREVRHNLITARTAFTEIKVAQRTAKRVLYFALFVLFCFYPLCLILRIIIWKFISVMEKRLTISDVVVENECTKQ